MALPPSFISELKFKNPIADVIGIYVPVKRVGRNVKCKCPFHNETDASLVIYNDTQSFYCFGCGAAGDVISFVRKIENVDYMGAVQKLADRAGLTVPAQDKRAERTQLERKKVLEINKEAARYFHAQLMGEQGAPGRNYFKARAISLKEIRRFGLGYATESWDGLTQFLIKEKNFTPEELILAAVSAKGKNGRLYDLFRHRVMIPIINIRGEVIGFGGRILEGNGPKYLNSADTPAFKKSRNLFAMNFAKSAEEPYFLLAEGYMDVIALHQGGFPSAVASLGTALTKEQAYLLSNYKNEIILTYDADEAGQKAIRRAITVMDELPVRVRVLHMDGAKDPDEYIRRFGAERYRKCIEKSLPSTEWILERAKDGLNLQETEDRVRYLQRAAEELSTVSDVGERTIYAGKVAEELGLMQEAVLLQIERFEKGTTVRPISTSSTPAPSEEEKTISKAVQEAEEMILAILYYHPDYWAAFKSRLSPELFSGVSEQKIFETFKTLFEQEEAISISVLSERLDDKDLSKVVYCINREQEKNSSPKDVEQYISILEIEKGRKSQSEIRQMEKDEFTDYIEKISKGKARGNEYGN